MEGALVVAWVVGLVMAVEVYCRCSDSDSPVVEGAV